MPRTSAIDIRDDEDTISIKQEKYDNINIVIHEAENSIDLSYDDRKGELILSMSSSIEKLKYEYPILLIDNLKDELILNTDARSKFLRLRIE
ncbi:hypothetical protein RI543_004426 [Arxiozyma heterogenica]|uniref:Uncharacterized protein n=1 Tax=Arxiozyma heterogenica TaxID=278026 RepID=A0AAN7VZJ6_9SACH|nr:hypothetical protein RI543_004426 [Kazachstania heterogenica]